MIETMIVYALSMLGTPYIWGGNNRLEGFDCSGFVLEALRSIGEAPHRDSTAYQISNYLRRNPNWHRADKERGSLLFFGTGDFIKHVSISLGDNLMIESGGGDRRTLTRRDAQARGAMVRVRPITSRRDYLMSLRLEYGSPQVPYMAVSNDQTLLCPQGEL